MDWLEEQEGRLAPQQLAVTEFQYSETELFHTVGQVEQVARRCPGVTRVRQGDDAAAR